MPRTSDVRALVGQTLIFGFEGTEISSKLRATLMTMQPAGVILFARNIAEPRQTWQLLHDCQAAVTTPLFRGVDMEGGTVDRLKNVISPAPSVADVAEADNKTLFRLHGRRIGEEIRALGFNVDYAPCLDLAFEASRSVLTSRTVSDDPSEIVSFAREFLKGLSDAGVIGCGKHFPGLGEGDLDSHKATPIINKDFKRLWNEDLLPYRKMVRELHQVMVCHASYPKAAKEKLPASRSKFWMKDTLRKKIGFKGLVLSDDMEMGGALAAASIDEAAVETLRAGADIILVCRNEEYVWRAFNAVLRETERDRRFRTQIERSAKRVLAFKKKSKPLQARFPKAPDEACINKLRRNMWELSEEVRLAHIASSS
jgi:beta-N-acetylhexosaminidase